MHLSIRSATFAIVNGEYERSAIESIADRQSKFAPFISFCNAAVPQESGGCGADAALGFRHDQSS
jgi:hypothetical protein